MKFHLPPSLRKALLACLAAVASISAPVATSLASGSFALGLAGYTMIAPEALAEEPQVDENQKEPCYSWVEVPADYTGFAPVATINGVECYVDITSPQGDLGGDTTSYCSWTQVNANPNGTATLAEKYKLVTQLSDSDTELESYDFSVSFDATTNLRTVADGTNSDANNPLTINNSFVGLESSEAISSATTGGAIHNNQAYIMSITGDFVNNGASGTEVNTGGGAIMIDGTYDSEIPTGITGDIVGDFIGNHVIYSGTDITKTLYARGGAIYNDEGQIGNITGDFINNYSIAINFDSLSDVAAYGGAIAARQFASFGDITGDFIGNYTYASRGVTKGGAIYAYKTTIGNITGDFIANYNMSELDDALGGAISLEVLSTIGDINGDFIGNHTFSPGMYSYGGAIYLITNTSTNPSKIGNITGDFINNYAGSLSGYTLGGAIYSRGKEGAICEIGNITGDFIGNYLSEVSDQQVSDQKLQGGAIYSEYSIIGNIVGDFIGNYIFFEGDRAAYDSSGGSAICNVNGIIGNITGSFIGNTLISGSLGGSARSRGAIHNRGEASSIALLALGGDVLFEGNYRVDEEGENQIFQAIENSYGARIYMNAYDDDQIIIQDSIDGDSDNTGYISINEGVSIKYTSADVTAGFVASDMVGESVAISGVDGLDLGTVQWNNEIWYQDVDVFGGTLQLGSYEGQDIKVDGEILTVNGATITTVDADADLYASHITVHDGATLKLASSTVYFHEDNLGSLENESTITIKDGGILDCGTIGKLNDTVDTAGNKLILNDGSTLKIACDGTTTAAACLNITTLEITGRVSISLDLDFAGHIYENRSVNVDKVIVSNGGCLVIDEITVAEGGIKDGCRLEFFQDEFFPEGSDPYITIADSVSTITVDGVDYEVTFDTKEYELIFNQISLPACEGYTLDTDTTKNAFVVTTADGTPACVVFDGMLGDEDGVSSYYTWAKDATTGEMSLVAGSEERYDIIAQVATDDNNRVTTGGMIEHSFIGLSGQDLGAAIYSSSSISSNSITVTGDFIANEAKYYGGAIYISKVASNSVSGDFIGNSAGSEGGAIYFTGSSGNKVTGDFIANSAGSYGGAILFDDSTNNTLSGDFIGNYASTLGGAIFLADASSITLLADTEDMLFTDNTAAIGEAIYMTEGSSVNMHAGADYTITFNDTIVSDSKGDNVINIGSENYTGTVTFNAAVSNGGSIKLNAGTLSIGQDASIAGGTLQVNGGKLDLASGKANATAINVTGLVLNANASLSLDIDLGTGMADVISATNVSGDYKLNLDSLNWLGELAEGVTSLSVQIADGNAMSAITLDDSLTIVTLDAIDYLNSYDNTTGKLSLTKLVECTGYSLNTTADTNAFAITQADGSTAYVVFDGVMGDYGEDTTFFYTWEKDATTGEMSLVAGTSSSYDIIAQVDADENKRVNSGGDIEHSFIGVSNAGGSGAAIYFNSVSDKTISGDFIANSAGNNGGAIYFYSSSSNEVTGNFIGNSSTNYGGAIYFYYSSSSNTVTGDFIGNTSNGGYGGAILFNGGTDNKVIGDFIGNSAVNNGGAILSYGGAIFMEGTGENNTVTGNFIGNLASYGGAISLAYSANITLLADSQDMHFTDNTALVAGEAIYMKGDSTVNMHAAAGKSITFNDTIVSGGTGDVINIGSETYTGTVNFNAEVAMAGTMNLIGGKVNLTDAITTNALTLASGTTWDISSTGSLMVKTSLDNAGAITGEGIVTLTAATTAGGDITAANLIVADGTNSFDTLNITKLLTNNGGTLTLTDSASLGGLSNDGLIDAGTNSITMTGVTTTGGAITADDLTLLSGTNTFGALTLSGTLTNASGTLTLTDDASLGGLSNSGTINAGSNSITMTGLTTTGGTITAADLTLVSGANTFGALTLSGTLTNAGDTLTLTDDASLGGLSNSGTIDAGTNSITLTGLTTTGGAITADDLTLVSGANTFGALTLSGTLTNAGDTLTLTADASLDGLSNSGTINAGTNSITMTGLTTTGGAITAGDLTLVSGANTFGVLTLSGTLTNASGTLTLTNKASLGGLANSGLINAGVYDITMTGVALAGGDITAADLTLVSGENVFGALTLSGMLTNAGGTLELTKDASLAGLANSEAIDAGTNNITLTAVTSTGGHITAGDLTLVSGANEFTSLQLTGTLTNAGGTLSLLETSKITNLDNDGLIDAGENTINMSGTATNGGDITAGALILTSGASSFDLVTVGTMLTSKATVSGTIGDGSAITTLSGSGSLNTNGAVSITNTSSASTLKVLTGTTTLDGTDADALANLTIADEAKLALSNMLEVNSTFNNSGSITGTGSITLCIATTNGGDITAKSLTLAEGENTFGDLVLTDSLSNAGTLTVDSFTGTFSNSMTGTIKAGSITATGKIELGGDVDVKSMTLVGSSNAFDYITSMSTLTITGDLTKGSAVLMATSLDDTDLDAYITSTQITDLELAVGDSLTLISLDADYDGEFSLFVDDVEITSSSVKLDDGLYYLIKATDTSLSLNVLEDNYWNDDAGSTGDWDDASSWAFGLVPDMTVGAMLQNIDGVTGTYTLNLNDAEKTIDLTLDAAGSTFVLDGTGSLTVGDATLTAGTLSVDVAMNVDADVLTGATGTLSIAAGAKLDIQENGHVTVDKLTSAGDIANSGSLSVGDVSSITAISGTGTLSTTGAVGITNISGNDLFVQTGKTTIDGAIADSIANLKLNVGTELALNGELSVTADSYFTNNGSITGTGSITLSNATTLGGNISADSLKLANGMNEFGALTLTGTLTNAGGTLTLTDKASLGGLDNSGTINAGDNSIIMTGVTTAGGDITATDLTLVSGANTFGALTLTGTLTNVDGTLTLTDSASLANIDNNGTIDAGTNSITMTGLTTTGGNIEAADLTLVSGANSFGALTLSGTLTNAGETLTLTGAADIATLDNTGSISAAGQSITIDSVTAGGDITAGSLTLTSGESSFTVLDVGTLTINGTSATVGTGTDITTLTGTGTLIANGAVGITNTNATASLNVLSGETTLNGGTAEALANVTLASGAKLAISGELTIGSGLNNSGTIKGAGSIVLSAATTTGGDIYVTNLSVASGTNSFDNLLINGTLKNAGTTTITEASTIYSLDNSGSMIANKTLTLTGTTTHGGNLTIKEGLNVIGATVALSDLSMDAGTVLTMNASADSCLSATNVTLGSSLTLQVNGTMGTEQSIISGINSISIDGVDFTDNLFGMDGVKGFVASDLLTVLDGDGNTIDLKQGSYVYLDAQGNLVLHNEAMELDFQWNGTTDNNTWSVDDKSFASKAGIETIYYNGFDVVFGDASGLASSVILDGKLTTNDMMVEDDYSFSGVDNDDSLTVKGTLTISDGKTMKFGDATLDVNELAGTGSLDLGDNDMTLGSSSSGANVNVGNLVLETSGNSFNKLTTSGTVSGDDNLTVGNGSSLAAFDGDKLTVSSGSATLESFVGNQALELDGNITFSGTGEAVTGNKLTVDGTLTMAGTASLAAGSDIGSLTGTGTTTILGDVKITKTLDANLILSSGTTTLDGTDADSIKNISIASDARLESKGDVTINGTLDNSGLIKLDGNLTVSVATKKGGNITLGEQVNGDVTNYEGVLNLTDENENYIFGTLKVKQLDLAEETTVQFADNSIVGSITGAGDSNWGEDTVLGEVDGAGTTTVGTGSTVTTVTGGATLVLEGTDTKVETVNNASTVEVTGDNASIGSVTGGSTVDIKGDGTTVESLDNATLNLADDKNANLSTKNNAVTDATTVNLGANSTLNLGTSGVADDLIFHKDELVYSERVSGSGAKNDVAQLLAEAHDTVIFTGENLVENISVITGATRIESSNSADIFMVALNSLKTDTLTIQGLVKQDESSPISTVSSIALASDGSTPVAGTSSSVEALLSISSISTFTTVDGKVELSLGALTTSTENGSYNIIKDTSGDGSIDWDDFKFNAATWTTITNMTQSGTDFTLTDDGSMLGFTIAGAQGRVWDTSSETAQSGTSLPVDIFKVPGGTELDSASILNDVDTVNVDTNRDITLHDYDTSKVPVTLNNLRGTAGNTLSITGDGIDDDSVKLQNTSLSNMAGTLSVEALTLTVASGSQASCIDTIALNDAALVMIEGNMLELNTLEVNGESTLTGTVTVDELVGAEDASLTGGVVALTDAANGLQLADGFTMTDVTLQMADTNKDATLELDADKLAGVTLAGSVGTIALSNAAGSTLDGIKTTGSDIDLGVMKTGLTVELKKASSITGGNLTLSYDTQSVLQVIEQGRSITVFSGEKLDMKDVAITINQEKMLEEIDLDYSKIDETMNIELFELSDNEDSSYENVTAEFGGETFLAKFREVRFEDGKIIIDVRGDIYTESTYTENGNAGASMLNDVVRNSKLSTDSDLELVLQSMDEVSYKGKNVKADALAAAISGATTTSLNAAQMGDMERNLRSLTSRNKMDSISFAEAGSTKFSAWIAAEGGNYDLDTHSTYAGTKLNNQGGSVGLDMQMSESFNAGLAFSAMLGDLSSTAGNDVAKGDMDNLYVSLYANYSSDSWTHSFAMSMGMTDASLDRTVIHDKGRYTSKGDTDGIAFAVGYEATYDIALNEEKTSILRPIFNVNLISSQMDGYTEKGTDAALRVGDQENLYATFGAGVGFETGFGDTFMNRQASLNLRALVKADVGNRMSEADVTLVSGSGYTETVKGNEPGKVGVEFGAGIALPMSETGSLFMDVSVDFREDLMSLSGGVGYKFSF